MKKFLSLILAIYFIIMCFCGCGSDNKTEKQNMENVVVDDNSQYDKNSNNLTHSVLITENNFFEFFKVNGLWTDECTSNKNTNNKIVSYDVKTVLSLSITPYHNGYVYYTGNLGFNLEIDWATESYSQITPYGDIIKNTGTISLNYTGEDKVEIVFKKLIPYEDRNKILDFIPYKSTDVSSDGLYYGTSVIRNFEIKSIYLSDDFKATYIHAGTSGNKALTYSSFIIDKYNYNKYFSLNSTKNYTDNICTYTINPIGSLENYDYDIIVIMADGTKYSLNRAGKLEIKSEDVLSWEIQDINGTIDVYPTRII